MSIQIIGGEIRSQPHNENYNALNEKIDSVNNNKIKTTTFTATSDNTTRIIHNLPYISTKDDLLVVYMGLLLERGVNYNDNADGVSIDLLNWSINVGDKILFTLYKNIR